ncbi:MAG: hypothetical protein WCE79_13485 [Xanthobacteraceae bacterium]
MGALTALEAVKGWQILIGALVALLAAVLTYRGAMAKVRFDSILAEEQTQRQRFKCTVQLDLALDRILAGTTIMLGQISSEKFSLGQGYYDLDDDEVVAAWNNIEWFSSEIARDVGRLRYLLRELKAVPLKAQAGFGGSAPGAPRANELVGKIAELAKQLRAKIEPLVRSVEN